MQDLENLQAKYKALQTRIEDEFADCEPPKELVDELQSAIHDYQNAKAEAIKSANQNIIETKENSKMDKKLFNEQFKAYLNGNKEAFFDAATGNNTAAATAGGALVPQELLGLAELQANDADLRRVCTVINATSGSGKIPAINYGQTCALVAFDENNALTEKAATFISVPYTMASKGAIIPVSRELINDSNVDPVAVIGKLFNAVYMADVNASICAVVEAGASVTPAACANVAAAIDEIKKQVIALPGQAKTVVIPKSIWASMAVEKNTVKGFLLAKDANGATVKQIEGAEVVVVEDATMSAKTILVGDFSTVYHVEAPGIEVASSEEAGFARNSCLVRCVARYIDKAVFGAALAKITLS